VGLATSLLGVSATRSESAVIDDQLARGLDFRALDFRGCFEQPTCVVGDVTISAEFRENDKSDWQPGQIYWDPIDGVGILGGGQDDEIDFNERLIVTFAHSAQVSDIWLTDLYVGEDQHYRNARARLDTEEDFEFAMIEFADGAEEPTFIEVSGLDILPDIPFNDVYTDTFIEDGDIHYRLLVSEDTATIIVPDNDGQRDLDRFITFKLGDIEPEKLALFSEDGQEFVYDLAEIFPEGAPINLYPEGSVNAQNIASLLTSETALIELRDQAIFGRALGDVTNGEVALNLSAPRSVDRVVFFSKIGTSNDFSVAGILLADGNI